MASTILVSSSTSQQWIPDERDAFILWMRGEFAAANAIIDALCQHLQLLSAATPNEYDSVLACIHQRRYNWNPVLHMQHYYSISDVIFSLQQVSMKKQQQQQQQQQVLDNSDLDEAEAPPAATDAPNSAGNQQQQQQQPEESKNSSSSTAEAVEKPGKRLSIPKLISGYEDVGGQQVNVMEGLRVYDNVLDGTESERLSALVAEPHAKKRRKGSKKSRSRAKDMIHFGTIPSDVPAGTTVFKEETAEPMPSYLESVIDSLVKSQVIPASKRPDRCSISVLEPGDYMPPHSHHHFDPPIFVLSLGSASTLSFGRNLKASSTGEVDGKHKVTLSVGSVLVLQGNSSELVQCAVSPLQASRTLVTFGSTPRASSKSKLAKRLSPPLRSVSVSPSLSTTTAAAVATSTVTSFAAAGSPIMLPVSTAQPMVIAASAAPYSPVAAVVAPTTVAAGSWSAPARVPSPGTGVFLPANSGTAIYNAQHQMNGRTSSGKHHYQHHHNHFHAGRKELVA